MAHKKLLSVIELGGYPEATHVYKEFPYQVTQEYNTRKAISYLKKNHVDVIVAEFNYQHTFRDRLSNLESLIAAAQKIERVKFIVLYEKEYEHYLDKIRQQFTFNIELVFPITAEKMRTALVSLEA
jgi:DNA integrity scanning protein DisA with diadenylate cyclase activity